MTVSECLRSSSFLAIACLLAPTLCFSSFVSHTPQTMLLVSLCTFQTGCFINACSLRPSRPPTSKDARRPLLASPPCLPLSTSLPPDLIGWRRTPRRRSSFTAFTHPIPTLHTHTPHSRRRHTDDDFDVPCASTPPLSKASKQKRQPHEAAQPQPNASIP
jgi:hypothetical protein